MNILEFKKLIDTYAEKFPDYRVTLPTSGIGGPHVAIKSVSCGFDFYDGQILLIPERAVSDRHDKRSYNFLFEQMLYRASNYDEVINGELTARYRDETKKFRNQQSAKKWLVDKLKAEIREYR